MRKILLILLIGGIGVLTNCGSGDDMPCLTCPDSYYEFLGSSSSQGYNNPPGLGVSSSSSYDADPWYPSDGNSSSSFRNSEPGNGTSSSSRQSGTIPGDPVSHGGETYETVVIGTQTWFKRNLNYNPSTGTSVCYNDYEAYCSTYGRLYDWSTAMGFDASCNSTSCSGQVSTKHRGICPSGWHIPNDAEWSTLINYVESDKGCSSCAGKHLNVVGHWNTPNGTVILDSYGFSALPGGLGDSGGSFSSFGSFGIWWSASEGNSSNAYYRGMNYSNGYANWGNYGKEFLFSVRCVQD
jgi:uncharacterized protein (TIGR02145 family)